MASKSKQGKSEGRYVEAYSWTDDGRFIVAPKTKGITVLSCTKYNNGYWFIVADPTMKRSKGPDVIFVEPGETSNGFSCNVDGTTGCAHVDAAKSFIAERPHIQED